MSGRKLPVRACRVIGADDAVATHHTVDCQRRGRAADFAQCCGCAFVGGIEISPDARRGTVECRFAGVELPHGRIDVAEAAARVRVGSLLGVETACVRSDVSADAVAELFVASRLRALPVVDEGRRLLGIVSKTDVLRSGRRRSKKTAADIMTPVVHGLPEDAPVAYAISLMAIEGLHEVPIVDADARLLGMITSTDALRWVAESLGYVLPVGLRPSLREPPRDPT